MTSYRPNRVKTLLLAIHYIQNWPAALRLRFAGINSKIIIKLRTGLKVLCRGKSSDWTVVHEMFLAHGYQRAFEYLGNVTSPAVVLDLGANIGCFSLEAAQRNSVIRVIAYEPGPPNIAVFEENLRLNPEHARRITLGTEAVSGHDGECVWFMAENAAGSNILQDSAAFCPPSRQFQVKLRSLASIVDSLKEDICLLKMDIEGSEHELVRDTPASVWKRIPAIAAEIHEDPSRSAIRSHVVSELSRLGYDCEEDRLGTVFCVRRESDNAASQLSP